MDPAAFAIEAPNMPRLLSMAGCPTHLACGDGDAMVSIGRLRALDPAATEIHGAGHNAMVDRPEAIWAWIDRCH
jgi:pimeloyl-ACP methyl ester carboxylesterase